MSKFISIGGMNPSGGEGQMNSRGWGRKLDRNPKAEEYYKSREENSGKSTGFSSGDPIFMKGTHGQVLHEEYNQHDHTVIQTVKKSSQIGSGTYDIKWGSQGPKTMVIEDIKRTFD